MEHNQKESRAEHGMSRRGFLKSSSFVVASLLLPLGTSALAAIASDSALPPGDKGIDEINDWVWIGQDNRVVIGVSQCEVGQGIFTGMAAVIASEMDINWQDVTVQFVTGRDAYRQVGGGVSFSQFVAASTSMANFYERIRLAGAQVRDLFERSGAQYFGVSPHEVETKEGYVYSLKTGEKIPYGELLAIASTLELNPEPRFKTAEEEAATGLVGQDVPRVDVPEKVDGSAIFGIDIDLPNLATCVPWMVPSFGGKIIRIRNEAEVRAEPGVIDLIITRQWTTNNMMGNDRDITTPNTVLVIAESYWQAKKAADRLDVEYVVPEEMIFSSESIERESLALLESDQLNTATQWGGAKQRIEMGRSSERFHEARYKAPYIGHATMEPVNATSFYHGDYIETWGPFQGQDLVRVTLSKLHGLTVDDIIVNNTYLGGSFGRKYLPDAVMHATTASKQIGRPVKVIYPREIDLRNEYYRPGIHGHYQATLDEQGYPEAISVRTAGQSLFWQMKRAKMEKMGFDETMVECVYNTIYKIPHLHVETGHVEQPVPLSYLRGVGTTSSIFFYESFISELAAKAGKDDYEYRRYLFQDQPAARNVLDQTAKAADWDKPLPEGTYRGMAYNVWVGRDNAFTTYIALVIELTIVNRKIKVHRAVCGIDCGKAINPSLIRANLEGGIGYALTGALKSKLTFENGAVKEGNFDTYPLLYLSEMPEVEVVIVESDRPPQGTGEIAAAVVAPAMASALHQATGEYFREMPFPKRI